MLCELAHSVNSRILRVELVYNTMLHIFGTNIYSTHLHMYNVAQNHVF